MKFNYEDTGEEVQGEIPVFVPETDEERKKRERVENEGIKDDNNDDLVDEGSSRVVIDKFD